MWSLYGSVVFSVLPLLAAFVKRYIRVPLLRTFPFLYLISLILGVCFQAKQFKQDMKDIVRRVDLGFFVVAECLSLLFHGLLVYTMFMMPVKDENEEQFSQSEEKDQLIIQEDEPSYKTGATSSSISRLKV